MQPKQVTCSSIIDEIKELNNVFGIRGDILIEGYDIDGKDLDRNVEVSYLDVSLRKPSNKQR